MQQVQFWDTPHTLPLADFSSHNSDHQRFGHLVSFLTGSLPKWKPVSS
jgi:hypothetical protein